MTGIGKLLSYSRPYAPHLGASVLLMAYVGLAQGLLALLIKPIFDRVLQPDAVSQPLLLLTIPGLSRGLYLDDLVPGFLGDSWQMVAFAILMVFLSKGVADYAGNYLVNFVGFSAITDLRQRVFDKVLRQSARFFEQNNTSAMMSAIMLDLEKIQVATSHILADLLRQGFTAMALLFVILQYDWRLSLVSLTVLPFVLIPTARIGKRIRRFTRRAQDDAAGVNQILQETLSGYQVVKSFTMEDAESERFRTAARALKKSNLRYVAQQALASPIIEVFGAITIVALLGYARSRILDQTMSAGEFTSFVIALLMLYEPVKRLTGIHNIFQQALGASQKVFEYLAAPEEIQDAPGALTLPAFHRAIAFDGVRFAYGSAPDQQVLRGLHFQVNAGEVVAIVGPSGAGKTTLVNLVPRFHDPTEGRVLVDGHDIRAVTLKSLRQQIAMVAQDTVLFDDTVRNNIRYGRPDASPQQVEDAARNAFADEFIRAFPQGYDTVVGERGAKLSGGQRQRLSIARALLKDPPILILDEATSHLDTQSEMLVQQALGNLMRNRTVIVIAHRLATVRRASRILVMQSGAIVEQGPHEELLARGGLYRKLYDMQFQDIEPVTQP
ncbi:MAG: ABC transporter ATP-binding protein/permease [Bryobacterales bacterium]|nr:ABC transporter ATP-binding protein/permease [Bryobacterales bacterium]